MIMTRAEHMAWAKARAIEYVDRGDLVNALASFTSDVAKHPDTESLGSFAVLAGSLHISNANSMRNFIEGFAE